MSVSINLYPHESLTLIVTFYSRLQQLVSLTGKEGVQVFAKATGDNNDTVYSLYNNAEAEVIYLKMDAFFQHDGADTWKPSRYKFMYNNWMGCKIGYDDGTPDSNFDDMSVFIKVHDLNYPMRLVHPHQPNLFANQEVETA